MNAVNGQEHAPSARELDLIAYLDGELEDARIEEVEARLASDPSYAAQLHELEALGGFVRDDAERIYRAAKVDSIADDVVARLADARTSALPPATAPAVRRAKSSVIWVSFGTVAAAAAATLVYMGTQPPSVTPAPNTAQTTLPAPTDTVAVKSPAATTSHDPIPPVDVVHPTSVEVQGLEVGQGATVIYSPEPGGSITPVVWINESDKP